MPERQSILPARRTTLIGRAAELREVRDLLLHSDGRLVTVTGAGGAGKTSLAVEVARLLGPDLPDGEWLVDLESVAEPELLEIACCAALGLADQGRSPREVLAEFLEPRQAMLLLDNCEHLGEPVARLVDSLLDRCPDLRILATSRVSLRVRGESVFIVPPMPVPDSNPVGLAVLTSLPSVELFVERAREADSTFALSAENAPAVAAICRRLDGLPLAIELAAAQVRALTPVEIAERLADEERLPAERRRVGPPRQQTMDAAIDWSERLLTPEQQAVFRRLGVFGGGWTLEAAERICRAGLDPGAVRDAIMALVEASLVGRETLGRASCFRLLTPIGEYARRKLAESGEAPATSLAHAEYFLELASRRVPGPVHASAEDLDRIAAEHENCTTAMRWAVQSAHVPLALGLYRALVEYWRIRGLLRLGLRHLEAALPLLDGAPSRPRAAILLAMANYRQLLGEHDAADLSANGALATGRELDDAVVVRTAYGVLGDVAADRGDPREARELYDRACQLLEADGDPIALGFWHANVGKITLREGRMDEAEEHLEKARALFVSRQPIWYLGHVMAELGALALRRGRPTKAGALLREALVSLQRYGAQIEAIDCLEDLGRLSLGSGDPARAATLFAAASSLRDETGVAATGERRARLLEAIEATRRRIPDTAFDAAWSEGLGFSLDEATVFAASPSAARGHAGPRSALPRNGTAAGLRTPDGGAPRGSALTRREREVAGLVARGFTNVQIADALVISPGTVRIHVERILGKLGLTSRVQVATWVVREDGRADPRFVTADV